MSIRILLIDDHPLFRKGVGQLVRDDEELELAGEASDGETGVALATTLDPDLILIDLNMRAMNGIETLRALKAQGVGARCVMLTMSDNERDVLEAMRAGADGYLLKELEPEVLCLRIRQSMHGALVLEDNIAGLLAHALNAPPPVLHAGCSNKRIARQLGISDATVKVHIKHLLRKLNVTSRLEAAVWALQNPRFREARPG
jgi:two-component system nitrate/nitrite response regulator NarL